MHGNSRKRMRTQNQSALIRHKDMQHLTSVYLMCLGRMQIAALQLEKTVRGQRSLKLMLTPLTAVGIKKKYSKLPNRTFFVQPRVDLVAQRQNLSPITPKFVRNQGCRRDSKHSQNVFPSNQAYI